MSRPKSQATTLSTTKGATKKGKIFGTVLPSDLELVVKERKLLQAQDVAGMEAQRKADEKLQKQLEERRWRKEEVLRLTMLRVKQQESSSGVETKKNAAVSRSFRNFTFTGLYRP